MLSWKKTGVTSQPKYPFADSLGMGAGEMVIHCHLDYAKHENKAHTEGLDFRGFDSSRIIISRGGTLRSIGSFSEDNNNNKNNNKQAVVFTLVCKRIKRCLFRS